MNIIFVSSLVTYFGAKKKSSKSISLYRYDDREVCNMYRYNVILAIGMYFYRTTQSINSVD